MEHLQTVLEWVLRYPGWTLLLIGAGCAGESIIVLGALIPTTLVLLSAGALVALGGLEFWSVLLAATAGAVTGDSINFWVGRRYGERALQSSYAERYAPAINRSRDIFQKHGAKGLIFVRFVGLLRPFMGAIAGAYRMSPVVFIGVETFAALIWAFPQLVVGVAFGASLDLAAEAATRLVVVIGALIVFLGLVVWGVRFAVSLVQAHAANWVHALLDWSHRHRRVGRLGEWLADPAQPETPGLAILAVLLLAASALWLWLWWGLAAHHPSPFDAIAYQTLKDLHTPLGLGLAVAVTQLGEWPVYVPVAGTMLLVLLVLQRYRAASHWIAAIGFGAVIALGLTMLLVLPDPLQYYRGELGARFSGRELVLATVVYGFIPVLLATGRATPARTAYYATGVSLIGLIALAQMYLGAQWLSVGIFSIVLGGTWIVLLAIGYRRHGADALHARRLTPVLGVFCIAAALSWSNGFQPRLASLTPVVRHSQQTAAAWWTNGYQKLPAYRIDLAGVSKQPLNIQWLGPLEPIEAALLDAGWIRTEPLNWRSALRWLSRAPLSELPVVPQIHAGQDQVLMLRNPIDPERQVLLRLWPSEWTLGGAPLWIGNVTEQKSRGVLRVLQIPTTKKEYNGPMQALLPAPENFTIRKSAAHPELEKPAEWDGTIWLLRPHE